MAERMGNVLKNVEYFDDGSKICLKVNHRPSRRSATFGFSRTSPEIHGKQPAPFTYSNIGN